MADLLVLAVGAQMNDFLGPYKYVIDAIVIAVLVTGIALGIHLYNDHQQGIGAARVQAQWDREKAQVAEQSEKARADAAAVTAKLQADAENSRKVKDAQIATLNSTLATAIAGLRERPSRDSQGGVPRDPTTGTALGATGAQLLRDDGEFLTRLASRADRLRLDLVECQTAYGKARAALNPAP